jgi:hypothetical protein
MGADGIAQPSERGADAPTIPSRDNSFLRFVPSHAGHAAGRSAVTNASNGFPQSRHSYSKRGMIVSFQPPATSFVSQLHSPSAVAHVSCDRCLSGAASAAEAEATATAAGLNTSFPIVYP